MKKILPSGLWLAILFLVFSVLSLSWYPIAFLDRQATSYIVDQWSIDQIEDGVLFYENTPESSVLIFPANQYPKWLISVVTQMDWHDQGTKIRTVENENLVLSPVLLLLSNLQQEMVTIEGYNRINFGPLEVQTSIWGNIYTGSENNNIGIAKRILSGNYLYQPWWSLALITCLVLGYLIAMAYTIKRGSTTSIWLLALGYTVFNLLLTWYLATTYFWWIPTIPLALAVLMSLPYYLQHKNLNRVINAFDDRTDNIRTELYQQYLDHEQFDVLNRQIGEFGFSTRQLEQLYELGLAFERKRSFDKACQVFDRINQLGGHKDSIGRIKYLKQVTGQPGELPNMQQTLVLDGANFELPQLGRYKIIREIGRGSMGIVYLAKDPKIDRDIALKTIQLTDLESHEVDSVKQRFFKEAQAAGRLNHPNIVTVFDVGEEKDVAYIAMDFVKGEPLSHYSKEDKLLGYKEIIHIIAQVADALKFAHDHDVVHRDIKPSNILYDRKTKMVKVSDFGIARIADSKQTQTGIVMGSPSFMSPEQIRGEPLTGKSDIFSLGVSLYQLLTGALPFSGDNLPGLAYAITHHKQRSIRDYRPELPTSLTRIVNKALHKETENRFADAGVLADNLYKASKKASEASA